MRALALGAALMCLAALAAMAGEGATDSLAESDIQSGTAFMSAATRAMQADDGANPGLLWAGEGETLWGRTPEGGAKSCQGCHGDARATMRGVATRYPQVDPASGQLLTLDARIEQCRTTHQNLPPRGPDSQERLALSAFVGLQSRGMAGDRAESAALAPFVARGRALFLMRQGQLDLSCSDCHSAQWGQRLGGSLIPQGHANGYPLYRLEWQGLGSLQRRIRGCLFGVRAEPWAADAPEYAELEAYLKWRARGLPIETPAVRP